MICFNALPRAYVVSTRSARVTTSIPACFNALPRAYGLLTNRRDIGRDGKAIVSMRYLALMWSQHFGSRTCSGGAHRVSMRYLALMWSKLLAVCPDRGKRDRVSMRYLALMRSQPIPSWVIGPQNTAGRYRFQSATSRLCGPNQRHLVRRLHAGFVSMRYLAPIDSELLATTSPLSADRPGCFNALPRAYVVSTYNPGPTNYIQYPFQCATSRLCGPNQGGWPQSSQRRSVSMRYLALMWSQRFEAAVSYQWAVKFQCATSRLLALNESSY